MTRYHIVEGRNLVLRPVASLSIMVILCGVSSFAAAGHFSWPAIERLGIPNLAPFGTGVFELPLVPEDVTNVALGKSVTSSSTPVSGRLPQVTDGTNEGFDGEVIELPEGLQWIQIDLGEPFELFYVVPWIYRMAVMVYYDVVIQVANKSDFSDAITVFNNDYDNSAGFGIGNDHSYRTEIDHEPVLIELRPPARTRYVRFYSNGNTRSKMNHMVELEVYGRKCTDNKQEVKKAPLRIHRPRPLFVE